MRISVVIPSFNCADLVGRAVASVKHVCADDVEIILVDDGSTDDTTLVVSKLLEDTPNLNYLRKSNGGLSSARNFGIARCTGDYILLLDADDELLPCDLVRSCAKGADMIRLGVLERDDSGSHIRHVDDSERQTGSEYIRNRFSAKAFYTPSWAYLYRREWLQGSKLTFMPGLIHEDNLFTVQALLSADSVITHSELVYLYIRREGSITKASDPRKLAARIRSLGIICLELTAIANRRPDIDLRWWIDETLHNAAVLAQRLKMVSARFAVLRMHLTYMASYRGFQSPGLRFIQRHRLKQLLFGYW